MHATTESIGPWAYEVKGLVPVREGFLKKADGAETGRLSEPF